VVTEGLNLSLSAQREARASDQLCRKLLKAALPHWLAQLRELEQVVPDAMEDFPTDNGGRVPERVVLMDDRYAPKWSQFTNHFKPTFKQVKREKQAGKPQRSYEPQPQTPYQRLLAKPGRPGSDESEAPGRTRPTGSVRLEEKHRGQTEELLHCTK